MGARRDLPRLVRHLQRPGRARVPELHRAHAHGGHQRCVRRPGSAPGLVPGSAGCAAQRCHRSVRHPHPGRPRADGHVRHGPPRWRLDARVPPRLPQQGRAGRVQAGRRQHDRADRQALLHHEPGGPVPPPGPALRVLHGVARLALPVQPLAAGHAAHRRHGARGLRASARQPRRQGGQPLLWPALQRPLPGHL